MRDRIVTVGIGVFMALGSVGGLEQGSMTFGQAILIASIGVFLIYLGFKERW